MLNNNNIILLSFATSDFHELQLSLEISALRYGITRSKKMRWDDFIKSAFYREHRDVLNQRRGSGYWLWKPYIVLETLLQMKDGDILWYCDSGCLFIDDPTDLLNVFNTNHCDIMPFDCRPLKNSEWIKRDAFIRMKLDTPDYYTSFHVIATSFLIRCNEWTKNFVKEWLTICEDPFILTDISNTEGENLPDYIDHRHDQSVFSLLIRKYNIPTFRNPSVWGNYLKMPAFRSNGELVSYPYALKPTLQNYSEQPQSNSPYGTILEFNRKPRNIQKSRRTLFNLVIKIKFQLLKGLRIVLNIGRKNSQ